MLRGLLKSVPQSDQRRFAPRAAKERYAGRQHPVTCIPHWDGNSREARRGREELTVVTMRRVQVADQPRRVAPCRIDKRVEMQRVHHLRDRNAESGPNIFASDATRARFRQIGRASCRERV